MNLITNQFGRMIKRREAYQIDADWYRGREYGLEWAPSCQSVAAHVHLRPFEATIFTLPVAPA